MAQQNTIGVRIGLDTAAAKTAVKDLESDVSKLAAKAAAVHVGSPKAAQSILNTLPSVSTPAKLPSATSSGIGSLLGGVGGALGSITGVAGSLLGGVGALGGAFMSVIPIVGQIGSMLLSAATAFGGMLMDVLGKGVDLLLGLPKMLAVGMAAVAGGVYAAHKSLGPAAEMEQYRSQLGHQGKADQLPFLQDLAKISRASLSEIVAAGVQSNNLGLDTKNVLPILNDVTAMMPEMKIDELVRSIGMLNSGRFGEALESLSRVGINRKGLEARGLTFDNGGSLNERDPAKVLPIIMAMLKERFGGASQKMGDTYQVATSNLGDSISQAFAKALEGALPYATKLVQTIGGVVDGIGEKISSFDWTSLGSSLLNLANEAASVVNSVDWAGMLAAVTSAAKQAADIAAYLFTAEGWGSLGEMLSGLWAGIISGLGATLSASASLLWEALKLGGEWILDQMLNLPSLIARGIGNYIDGMKTAFGVMAVIIEQAIVKGGNALSALLTASLISVLPSIALDAKGRELKRIPFGERVARLTDEENKRSGPTVIDTLWNALKRDMDAAGKRSGVTDIGLAMDNFRKSLREAGKGIFDHIRGFSDRASRNADGKGELARKWEDYGPKQQNAQREIKEAVIAGNMLTSQMLQELKIQTGVTQSELAEAMFA